MLAAVAVGLLGLTILVGAITAMFWRLRFLLRAVHTTAIVTHQRQLQEEGTSDYRMVETVYESSLEFFAGDGSLVRFTHQHGRSLPTFCKGDRVRIRYKASAPATTAELPSVVGEILMWVGMVLGALMGFVFGFAGLAMGAKRGA